MIRSLALMLTFAVLTGCTLPLTHPDYTGLPENTDPADFTCCTDPERLPGWFAGLARVFAEPLGPVFSATDQPGALARHPEARARIADGARPMDLLVFSSKSHLTSRMLSGWFTHSALYLGTEAELRAAGLWNTPALHPHHAAIRAGKVVLESVPVAGVHLVSLDEVLSQRDAVALLRPALSPAQKRAAIGRALPLVGRRFDYVYDIGTCDCLACSELVLRALAPLDFPLREVFGIPMLLPDDIAAKAIRGDKLRLVEYLSATPESWRAEGLGGAMESIARFWGPAPLVAPSPVIESHTLATCTQAGAGRL